MWFAMSAALQFADEVIDPKNESVISRDMKSCHKKSWKQRADSQLGEMRSQRTSERVESLETDKHAHVGQKDPAADSINVCF